VPPPVITASLPRKSRMRFLAVVVVERAISIEPARLSNTVN